MISQTLLIILNVVISEDENQIRFALAEARPSKLFKLRKYVRLASEIVNK